MTNPVIMYQLSLDSVARSVVEVETVQAGSCQPRVPPGRKVHGEVDVSP